MPGVARHIPDKPRDFSKVLTFAAHKELLATILTAYKIFLTRFNWDARLEI